MSRNLPLVIALVSALSSVGGFVVCAAGETGLKASRSTAPHRATLQSGAATGGAINQVQLDTPHGEVARYHAEGARNIRRTPGTAQPAQRRKKLQTVQRHKKKVQRKRCDIVPQSGKKFALHGMLQSPSRYDPPRGARFSGVADPDTRELTHDHFQELDRNRDGAIDPFERTLGRLDMDRDRATHRWE